MLVRPEAVLDGIQPLYPSRETAADARDSSWAERERFEDAVAVLRRLIGLVDTFMDDCKSRDEDVRHLLEHQLRLIAEERALRAEHTDQVNRVLTEYKSCLQKLRDALPCDQR